MTAQRQEANRRPGLALIALRAGLLAGLGAAGMAALVLPALTQQVLAATTERLVVNRYSGLAMEGYDPVAYFADGHPSLGLADFEAAEAGAIWRFRNEGNRASFIAHPDIYGPQFGGYDPIDVARGVTYAGNPRFWLVSGQRLYLFGREENRDAFAADPQGCLKQATVRWPGLEQELSR